MTLQQQPQCALHMVQGVILICVQVVSMCGKSWSPSVALTRVTRVMQLGCQLQNVLGCSIQQQLQQLLYHSPAGQGHMADNAAAGTCSSDTTAAMSAPGTAYLQHTTAW